MITFLYDKFAPLFLQDHLEISLFFISLSYALLLLNWLINTDWETKLNYSSLLTCLTGLLYLHYSSVRLLLNYELAFLLLWSILFLYHVLAWHSNYTQVMDPKNSNKPLDRRKRSQILRYLITLSTTKNSAGHWHDPPLRNGVHLLLGSSYAFLIWLHLLPYLPLIGSIPLECMTSSSNLLCCRYNYVMQDQITTTTTATATTSKRQQVSNNFCSANVNIAFAGSWSTGKTYLINALLGDPYATAISAPSPSTDKFTCIALGRVEDGYYCDPIRSEDYEIRKHCEIMGHVNDVVGALCSSGGGAGDGTVSSNTKGGGTRMTRTLKNVVDVAHVNEEFDGFVFFDMPGFQREYGENCLYRNFYKQLIDQIDYTFVVWDVNHGKIEDEFGDFFHNKARGVNYEIIYNRYDKNSVDMSFLNQQYAKLSGTGQEVLSEMYTIKVHENSTTAANENVEFEEDIVHLRAKIKSVNQTVHDNRKKLMKANLLEHERDVRGMFSLYRSKMSRRLIEWDLNPHVKPRMHPFTSFLLSIFRG